MLRSVKFGLAAAMVLTAAPAALAQDVIKIGAPVPLTGPLSPEGLKQKQGYDLWVNLTNAKGGIKAGGKTYKVELVYADYASNTPRAVQTAERLITEDKVNFLFGPFGSGATKAASSVSEKYAIPTISNAASSVQVYDQNYKYLFGILTANDTVAEPIAEALSKNPAIKKVAILARNDLFPLAVAEELQKSAKKRGMEVVMFEKYAIGTMDHASAITQMRAAKADWIVVTGYTNDLILARKQMKDLGVGAQVVTQVAGPAYKEYVDALGPLAEGVTSMSWWHPAVRYDGKGIFGSTENFNKLWNDAYKSEADYSQASAAACGEVLQMAIEKADSIDPAKVRDAIASIDTVTFYGPMKFAAIGIAEGYTPPVFQIQGGKPLVLVPAAVKQGELKLGVQ